MNLYSSRTEFSPQQIPVNNFKKLKVSKSKNDNYYSRIKKYQIEITQVVSKNKKLHGF